MEYYALRGWDTQGRPTVEKLEEPGVEERFIAKYKKELNNERKNHYANGRRCQG